MLKILSRRKVVAGIAVGVPLAAVLAEAPLGIESAGVRHRQTASRHAE